MIKHLFLVYRIEKLGIGAAIIVRAVTSELIANDLDLVNEIRGSVEKLVHNGSLQSEWEYAGSDMNIGDICDYADKIMEMSPNIFKLSFESVTIPNHWTYDTSLCDID